MPDIDITPYSRRHLVAATLPYGRGKGAPVKTVLVDPETDTFYCRDCEHSAASFAHIIAHRRTAHPKSGRGVLPPDEASLRGQVAAHASWANTPDRAARTAKARAALDRKFLDEADGDPVRAEHLRKAHFARLALKSARSRRIASEARAAAREVEAELREMGGA